jgi:hypothetical protein
MHRVNASNNPRIPVTSGMFPFQVAQSSDEEGKRGNGEDDVIDPWDVYGGNSNIAAACRATNEEVQTAKQDNAVEHDEKQRQLAAGRLTGWQSRERKRIMMEATQERKDYLTQKNAELRTENEHLQNSIKQIKEARRLGSGGVTTRAAMNHHPSLSQQDGLFYSVPPGYNARRELPPPVIPNNSPRNNLFTQSNSFAFMSVPDIGQHGFVPSTFAPLSRSQQDSLSRNTPAPSGFDVTYLRTLLSEKRQVAVGDLRSSEGKGRNKFRKEKSSPELKSR